MIKKAIERLNYLMEISPKLLLAINEDDMTAKPIPGKWSKKEIIGHLIDSATNNHQRFVRAQFEHHPEIRYDQNKWNEHSFYQQIDTKQIISFWALYNKQLIALIKNIPAQNLTRKVKIGDSLFPLEFLIVDYVEHLEHHLKQIINY